MNKKIVAMVTSLVIGSTMLLGTTYANAKQLSGYDSYKAAIKDTKNLKNETANLKVSVYDNGSDIMDMTTNAKINLASDAMSHETSLKSSTETETFNIYRQNGKNISKSSSSPVYNVRDVKARNNNKAQNPEIEKSVETIVDTLTGNMKNNVSVTDNNGSGKKVSINLSENDVTPLVNAVTSIAFIGNSDKPVYKEKAGEINLSNVIPKLQSNVKVKSAVVTGDINNNDILNNQTAKIVITGTDAQGKTHEITINMNFDIANINSTTPDTVDLTGKQVKNITQQFREEN